MILTFPNIVEYKQSNGLNVIFVRDNRYPVITANLVFPTGSLSDNADIAGCNDILSSLLIKGSKNYPVDDFSKIIESKGAAVFAESTEEYTLFGIKMLTRYKNELLPVFFDAVKHPEMSQTIFSRLKKEFISALSMETTNPMTVATKHFNKLIFGKNHPAGNIQTISSVNKIKLSDVIEKYKNNFSLNGAYLIIGGAFSIEEMQSFVSSELEYQLPKDNRIKLNIPAPPENRSLLKIVDNPSLSQSSYICGHIAPSEFDKSKIPLSIANYILGGGNFSSRLMKTIRSQFGKTYGISSTYKTTSGYGLFYIMTSTLNYQLKSVANAIDKCYYEFIENGPSEEELTNAKQYVRGSLKFELEGIPKIINTLIHLHIYERNNDYLSEYLRKVEELTVNDVKKILGNNFGNTKMSAVVVGKYSEVSLLSEDFAEITVKNFKDNS